MSMQPQQQGLSGQSYDSHNSGSRATTTTTTTTNPSRSFRPVKTVYDNYDVPESMHTMDRFTEKYHEALDDSEDEFIYPWEQQRNNNNNNNNTKKKSGSGSNNNTIGSHDGSRGPRVVEPTIVGHSGEEGILADSIVGRSGDEGLVAYSGAEPSVPETASSTATRNIPTTGGSGDNYQPTVGPSGDEGLTSETPAP